MSPGQLFQASWAQLGSLICLRPWLGQLGWPGFAPHGLSFSRRLVQAWPREGGRVPKKWKPELWASIHSFPSTMIYCLLKLALIQKVEGKNSISWWEALQSHLPKAMTIGKGEELWPFFYQCRTPGNWYNRLTDTVRIKYSRRLEITRSAGLYKYS